MVNVRIETNKSEFVVGEEIVATVVVDDVNGGGSREVVVKASVTVDGVVYTGEGPILVTWPASEVVVDSVSGEGLQFEQTDNPFVWKAFAL